MENETQEYPREYYIEMAKKWTPNSKPQINSSLPPDIKSLAYSIFFETFRYKPKRKSQTNPYII